MDDISVWTYVVCKVDIGQTWKCKLPSWLTRLNRQLALALWKYHISTEYIILSLAPSFELIN